MITNVCLPGWPACCGLGQEANPQLGFRSARYCPTNLGFIVPVATPQPDAGLERAHSTWQDPRAGVPLLPAHRSAAFATQILLDLLVSRCHRRRPLERPGQRVVGEECLVH